MTATITPYRPPQQAGQDGFAQLLHAEWTKFRTLRGWVIAIVIAAVLIDVVALLVPRDNNHCSAGCQSHVPTGPGGEAVNDSYYLVGQPLAGDGSITVRVTSLTGVIENDGGFVTANTPQSSRGLVPWAKAGIIITDSTRPGSAYAAMMVTGSHGVRMQYDYTGDIAGLPGSVSAASPRWLRLTRSGDVITGYDSTDGRHWTEVGTARLAGLTGAVKAGMFATSPLDFTPNFPSYAESGGGASASVATGTFDVAELRGGAPGGRWAGQYVGANDASFNGPQPRSIGFRQADGRFTVTGSGDIGPVVAGGVNSSYVAGTLADHLLGVFIGLLIMVVIAAMFITVEYRRGLIRTTLAASPRRGRLLAAKALVIGLLTFVLGSAAVAVAVIAGSRIAQAGGTYVLPVGWLDRGPGHPGHRCDARGGVGAGAGHRHGAAPQRRHRRRGRRGDRAAVHPRRLRGAAGKRVRVDPAGDPGGRVRHRAERAAVPAGRRPLRAARLLPAGAVVRLRRAVRLRRGCARPGGLAAAPQGRGRCGMNQTMTIARHGAIAPDRARGGRTARRAAGRVDQAADRCPELPGSWPPLRADRRGRSRHRGGHQVRRRHRLRGRPHQGEPDRDRGRPGRGRCPGRAGHQRRVQHRHDPHDLHRDAAALRRCWPPRPSG